MEDELLRKEAELRALNEYASAAEALDTQRQVLEAVQEGTRARRETLMRTRAQSLAKPVAGNPPRPTGPPRPNLGLVVPVAPPPQDARPPSGTITGRPPAGSLAPPPMVAAPVLKVPARVSKQGKKGKA